MSEEKKEKKSSTIPSQLGNSFFEGRKATEFWVRAFDLEEEVEAVRKLIAEKSERKRAVIPIVAEYRVDEEFKFIYLIQVYADALGVQDGVGIVYWASPEHEAKAYEKRDSYAKRVLNQLTASGKFDECVEIEAKGEE